MLSLPLLGINRNNNLLCCCEPSKAEPSISSIVLQIFTRTNIFSFLPCVYIWHNIKFQRISDQVRTRQSSIATAAQAFPQAVALEKLRKENR
mmetsp:Transcript_39258/g.100613  ORF Transcript_39258/g.100613 Transcript_39258/m.100613 type:complete len:92 (+) Transcript_39258:272-547(+)